MVGDSKHVCYDGHKLAKLNLFNFFLVDFSLLGRALLRIKSALNKNKAITKIFSFRLAFRIRKLKTLFNIMYSINKKNEIKTFTFSLNSMLQLHF